MDLGGRGHGDTPKTLRLQRALSGGFGFSLMGGRGTGFPPVICDILSDSPASECDGMQVGDIIIEINHESMENKSTKEVVTALMKSPDDLILKVREDVGTREKVLKFLAPLEKSPHRGQRSAGIIRSALSKTDSQDFQDNNACSSEGVKENGIGKVDLEKVPSAEPEEQSELATTCRESVSARMLQSPVLPNRMFNSAESCQGSESGNLETSAAIGGQLSEELDEQLLESLSHNGDPSSPEDFAGQKLTTTALIHREDSSKEGYLSKLVNQRGPHSCLGDLKEKNAPSDNIAYSEVNMNGSSHAELVRITSAEYPSIHCQNKDVRTRLQDGTESLQNSHVPSSSSSSSSSESAFSAAGSAPRVRTAATSTGSNKSVPVEVSAPYDDSGHKAPGIRTPMHAIGIQTNASDLEARIGNGMLVANQKVPGPPAALRGHSTHSDKDVGRPDEKLNTQLVGNDAQSTASSDEGEFPDMNTLESALNENTKNLDKPSAKRLAKRLYELDGFKREDVSVHLSKRNDFSKLVAKEYLEYFDFTGDRLDDALRDFLHRVTILGETQERERVLAHFSHRYYECNPSVVETSDASHTLTCALMLLNTDLHGQNIGKKMTLNAFVSNLEGMNDGTNFARTTLKALYNAIKLQPLEWNADEDDSKSEASSVGRGPKKTARNGTMTNNPLVQIEDDPNAPIYTHGYIMRKVITDAEGKKTPKGKRSWKMYYATVKGLCLYLHKSEVAKDSGEPKELMRLHHALASRSSHYDKKPNVFSIRLANWSEFLIQCLDASDMQKWMQAVNLAAAVHSSPPLPAAVGSQVGFTRPVLPSTPSKHTPAEQLASHDEKIEGLEQELEDHRNYPPDKKAKPRIIRDYKIKDEYLEHEVTRFKTYIYLLRSKPFSTLPPQTTSPPPSSTSSPPPSSTTSPSPDGKKMSPSPTPKFATYSSSRSPYSTPAAAAVAVYSSNSSIQTLPKPGSSSSMALKHTNSLSEETKQDLRKTNSYSGCQVDPLEQGPAPPLRDNSHKMESDTSEEPASIMPLINDEEFMTSF